MNPAYFDSINSGFPLLSLLIFMPLAGAMLLLLVKNESFCRYWSLAVTSVVALLSLILLFTFDKNSTNFQFAEVHPWVEALKINYVVALDGISILSCRFVCSHHGPI